LRHAFTIQPNIVILLEESGCMWRFKLILIACFVSLVACTEATAQSSYRNASARNNDYLTPAFLAKSLTANATSEKQKVETIFRWITDNIEYKVKPLYATRLRIQSKLDDVDTGALKPLSERVAEKVLDERIAFCDGYARLFTTLCSYAGIQSQVVTGYARLTDEKGLKFRSNHSWNAVYIDSTWHLVDATWASGYITFSGGQFIKQYNDFYFLTPPAEFIRTHYPEDLQWSLLNEPPTLKEYESTPFRYTGFSRKNIQSFSPSKGIIEASVGDTLTFELVTNDPEKYMRVVDSLAVDSVKLTQVNWWEYPIPPYTVDINKIYCSYVVTSAAPQWLSVVYNNDVVLRYRLRIKKGLLAKDDVAIK
jgi:hypothetical protein